MNFSELQPRIKRKGTAHFAWSGVASSEAELSSRAFAVIEAALPRPPNHVVWLRRNLMIVARRLHRDIRQDEFGPNRRDQKAMVSAQIAKLSRLQQLLSALDHEAAIDLSEDIHAQLSKTTHIDSDTIFQTIRDANPRRCDELVDEIQAICVWLISCTDTNTAAHIFDYEVCDPNLRFVLPARDLFSVATALTWLDHICTCRKRLLKVRGRVSTGLGVREDPRRVI